MTNQNKFSVGEFSKRTGISIRTLHYYDEIGLLIPERDSSSGHRIYTHNNLLTLQKIINLKFVGYRLEEITEMINEDRFDTDLSNTLTLHMSQLEQEKKRIEHSLTAIKRVIQLIQEEGELDSAILFSLIQNMQTENMQKEWIEKYRKEDSMDKQPNKSEEEKVSLERSTIQIYKEIKALNGMPIEKPEVQAVIRKYLKTSYAYLGENTTGSFAVGNMEALESDMAELDRMTSSPFTEEEEEWLNQAIIYYMKQVGGDWRSSLS